MGSLRDVDERLRRADALHYPKVLTLSVATLLIGLYAHRPSRWLVTGSAGLAAVAFLFRDDLAVHVSVGLLLGFAVTANRRRAVGGDVLTYGAINEARQR